MLDNTFRKTAAGIAALTILLGAFTGCSSDDPDSDTVTSGASSTQAVEEEETSAETSSGQSTSAVKAENMSSRASDITLIDTAELFSSRDLEQTPDLSDAEEISVEDGKTISITSAGVYVISGSAANCTIKVEASADDKVQLVLDGVSVKNTDSPAIYVVSADKCFITLAEDSENDLEVTGTFKADGETNTDAVIFSKDDVVFNGTGKLSITSTDNGISCKDDIKFTGGEYVLKTTSDSVEAKDSILIYAGNFTIDSGKDGFHAENEDDDSKGCVYTAGGSFSISAKSDGIQGNAFVQIDGGEFGINASEGIEGTYVRINDGTINISASDDGINAVSKSSSYDVAAEFNGGHTTIKMSGGDVDAIDVNGYVYVNGGTLEINMTVAGMSESFDYDKGAEFNGGTIIINGEEVSEIPTPKMMGGGFGGGRGGFGEPPEGFDGSSDDFKDRFGGDFKDFGDFDGDFKDFGGFGDMPEGFEGFGEPPEGFDGNFDEFKDKFNDGDFSGAPGDFKDRGGRKRGNSESGSTAEGSGNNTSKT